jgi:hypothetical protein
MALLAKYGKMVAMRTGDDDFRIRPGRTGDRGA